MAAFASNPAVAAVAAQQVAAYAAVVSTDEIGAMLEKLIAEAELLQTAIGLPTLPSIHGLVEALIVTRRSRDTNAATALLKKAVEGLLDTPTLSNTSMDTEIIVRSRDLHLRILKCLQDPRAYGMQWTNKSVTRCLMECREDFRYNLEAVDCLIR